jgi:uncharacterized protein (DUF1330 family)
VTGALRTGHSRLAGYSGLRSPIADVRFTCKAIGTIEAGSVRSGAGFCHPRAYNQLRLSPKNRETPMPAYFVFHNRIKDPAMMTEYIGKAFESLAPYNVEFLVADENSTVIEGETHLPRTIVIKFPTREMAEAWYNSPVYREILPLRLAATEGYAVIVDGYAPAN